jgi:MurNAc alpha-1-phosphate uridylyltransferase
VSLPSPSEVPTPGGVALAAGAGTRLRPLTDLRPKALCPVGGRPLVDLALERLTPLTGAGPEHLAVNAHHHAARVEKHLAGRVHVQVETGEALGTAGGLAGLLPWLDGRAALVTNADTYLPGGLVGADGGFTDGWDGERSRLLCVATTGRPDFTDPDGLPLRYVGTALLPWARIRRLKPEPSGLYEVLWRDEARAGELDLVRLDPTAVVVDCGTPADYLAANLHACGGDSWVGRGATVLGRVERSVIWDGAWVGPEESLVGAIRAGDHRHPVTVTVPADHERSPDPTRSPGDRTDRAG